MKRQRIMLLAAGALALVVGFSAFVQDANACHRRRRCCGEETSCCNPCGATTCGSTCGKTGWFGRNWSGDVCCESGCSYTTAYGSSDCSGNATTFSNGQMAPPVQQPATMAPAPPAPSGH